MAVYRVGSNKSSVNNFPVIRPTLDLDFANSKTLDPRITFTRASGGSYVGADGLIKYAGVNEARFDHDPATSESLGLLIEESRTNLVTRSEDFNFYLSINSSIIPNTDISPTSTSNATKLIENTTNLPHYIGVPVGTITPGKYYTFSCFAKSTNPNRLFSLIFENSSLFGGSFPRASFDLISGKIHTITSATSAKIENYGNGWYRCSLTAIPSVTGNTNIQLRLQTNVTASSMIGPYTGDGVSNIFIWGAQAEEGTFPTSYIPTQGTTRTRQQDIVRIIGSNFSDFYNKNQGTIVMTYRPTFDGVYQSPYAHLFSIGNNNLSDSNLSIGLAGNLNSTSQLYFIGYNNLGHFTWLSTSTPNSKVKQRVVVSYTDSYIRLYQNELTFSSISPIYGANKSIPDLIPTITKLSSANHNALGLGNSPSFFGSSRFNCTIQNFKYYPKELGNEMVKNLSRKVSP